jgi:Helix-turn-helix domain
MSQEAISWVFRHSISKGRTRAVLMWIAYHADENGEGAYPSIRTLCSFTGSYPRAIRQGVRKLEKIREIHIKLSASTTGTNIYSIPGVRKAKMLPPVELAPPRRTSIMYINNQKELWQGPETDESSKEDPVRKDYLEYVALKNEGRIPKSITWEMWEQMTEDRRKKLQAG